MGTRAAPAPIPASAERAGSGGWLLGGAIPVVELLGASGMVGLLSEGRGKGLKGPRRQLEEGGAMGRRVGLLCASAGLEVAAPAAAGCAAAAPLPWAGAEGLLCGWAAAKRHSARASSAQERPCTQAR